jgi:acyl-CoA reductase-like NAD-dependent aldehyde dehydrogenase
VRPQSLPTETKEIISRDPATGEEFGHTPITDSSEVAQAVHRARAAQLAWARLSYHQRGEVMRESLSWLSSKTLQH